MPVSPSCRSTTAVISVAHCVDTLTGLANFSIVWAGWGHFSTGVITIYLQNLTTLSRGIERRAETSVPPIVIHSTQSLAIIKDHDSDVRIYLSKGKNNFDKHVVEVASMTPHIYLTSTAFNLLSVRRKGDFAPGLNLIPSAGQYDAIQIDTDQITPRSVEFDPSSSVSLSVETYGAGIS